MLSDHEFESTVDQNFTTVLSNCDEVAYGDQGTETKLRRDNVGQFISLVLKARSTEASEQIKSIKEGINFVINYGLSSIEYLSPSIFEEKVCGERKIEVDELKSITTYPNCKEDHEIVERFWRVFEEFTQEERALYLMFVWGRNRLPTDLENVTKHELRLMTDMSENCFPRARTCFFQLDIPFY